MLTSKKMIHKPIASRKLGVPWEGHRGMDGSTDSHAGMADTALARAFVARTAAAGDRRLADALAVLMRALGDIICLTNASRADLRAVIGFLTEVGEACDDKRQEWVLLSDVLGLTSAVEDHNASRPEGATPNTMPGPFYRPGAPLRADGQTVSLDGQGPALRLDLTVAGLNGVGIEGALVEIWQANAAGIYENQEPDLQPEFNLRGSYRSGPGGRLSIRTVRPAGYAIPDDGPVGRLMAGLGLPVRRPAHLHFRITAPGFQTLTTHVFDRADPAIHADPLFCVHPDLLCDLLPEGDGWRADFRFVLAGVAPGPDL